jgi:glucan endo-1,3-alpha-glucosidase
LNTGFKLFFSVDMSNTNDIVQMISSYAHRTNSFYYNNRLVLSSYLLNALDWTNGVFQPLQSLGVSNVFFVPFFNTESGYTWQTLAPGTTALVSKYGSFIDGLFDFGGEIPADVTNMNAAYFQACKSGGKLFMATCSPMYWGCVQPYAGRPYFETQGGEGIATEWGWVIQNQPDWVEIVTWNDLNEGTYINPEPTPDQYNQSPPKRYCHAGYLALTKRYITWYKTGQQPPITQDALFYFYRTHSTNAVATSTNDTPVTSFLGNVQDVIYTTVTLTTPGSLEIISGNSRTTNSLPAGISNLRTPFSPGSQQFTLRRSGVPPLIIHGPDILSQITNYDYFTASGYTNSPAQIAPPDNLQINGG